MLPDNLKILVVEDDVFAQTIIKDALERLGYEIVMAGNGREALELCQTVHFPIIITDWVMPEMDGIDFCRAMRATPSEQYVFILLLTALDKKDELIAGLDAGADEYLVKPFHEVELAARLRVAQRILDLESSLKQLALHDQLTGVYNRRIGASRARPGFADPSGRPSAGMALRIGAPVTETAVQW